MPSHRSGCGPIPPWQTSAPLTHAVVPGVHGGWLMPHETPTPLAPSSTWPSQSLSMPSHTSGDGPMKPMHTLDPHSTRPIVHWLVPP